MRRSLGEKSEKMTSRMSDRKKRKRKEEVEDDEDPEPSDEQTEIAKYLRFNCPTKSSNYQGENVQYFKGFNAVDCLLDSKWSSGAKRSEILFTNRQSVEDYLYMLLELGMFHRVVRVRKKKKGEKDDGKKTSKDSSKSMKDSTEMSNEADGKKTKVKVKLELHDRQEFLDGDEVYMWIYDPIHPKTIIYGVLVVIGAIIMCLFPLWPMQMREYVWYLSVVAAILLGALIGVALLRYVVFSAIWIVTIGRHHFWFLPNLTEECGFLESFLPVYSHTYTGGSSKEDKEQEEDKENGKDNEGVEEAKDDDDDSPKTKETEPKQETEPWIQVTKEDVAQAKQATGNESDDQPTVAC